MAYDQGTLLLNVYFRERRVNRTTILESATCSLQQVFFKSSTGWERVSLLVTGRAVGRRLPSKANVSGRSLKLGFVSCMVVCELLDVSGFQNFGEFLMVST